MPWDAAKYREYRRLWMSKQRKVRRMTGICIACSKAAVPGKVQCSDHLARSVRYSGENRKRRLSQGLCIYCGKKPSRPGRRKCFDCGVLMAGRQQKRRDAEIQAQA